MKLIGLHPHNRLGHIEAVEGANMLEKQLQNVSNNVANIKTPGFKKERMTFEEYLLPQMVNNRRAAKGEVTKTDFTQGFAQLTENPLDFMIEGDGFFVVQGNDKLMYTRSGNFTLNGEGQLVTNEGLPVLGDGQPIVINDTTGTGVWLSEDNILYSGGQELGKLDVVVFDNNQGLERLGGNMYAQTNASGDPVVSGSKIKQGYIEGSNVNPVESMVSLIDLYRQYEAQQKTLQTVDGLDNRSANDVGKVT